MSARLNLADLSAELLHSAEANCASWFPAGKKRGHEFKVGSLSGEPGESLSINLNNGAWADFATGETGADLIDLYAAKMGCTAIQAARMLTGTEHRPHLTAISPPPRPPEPARKVIAPVPNSVEPHDCRHSRHGDPSRVWSYTDSNGDLMGYVARYDTGQGKKEIVPWTYTSEGWGAGQWPEPRPLYGLHELAERPTAPVLIVEGEKTADAARVMAGSHYVVVTWPGGSNAHRKADFSVLHGRKVLFWPDADAAGLRCAQEICARLLPICPEVKVIDVTGMPDGWDAADTDANTWEEFLFWAKPRASVFSTPAENKFEQHEKTNEIKDVAKKSSSSGSASATTEIIDPDTGEITHEPAPENEPLDLFAEFPAPTLQPGMLPDAIFDYAAECSELIGASPEMIAVPALVACAAALHDGVCIQPKRFEPEWTESARLWCAIVGSPSVKKTPSISRATKRLRGINATLAEENARVQAKFDEQCDQYKKDKKIADKTGDFVQAPEKPKLKRLLVEDITIEALSEILKDNDRGILCIQDELSGWFGSMDAYSSGKSGNKDRAAWLQAYNGGHRQVDRIMRGAVHVPNFSVSMIGGIQPDAIRRLAAQMPEDGLMQRFMIVIGTEHPESDRIKDSDAFNRYGALVDHLYAITPAEKPVKLTEAAHIVREHLNAYASDLIKYSSLPGALKAAIGKWSGLFARLTLLFHAIDCRDKSVHPVNCEVSGDTSARVSKFIRLFLLPHSIAYYTDILNAGTEIENARWIAGYILSRKLTDIDNREITRAYNAWRGFDKWRRQRVMAILEDAGWVTPVAQIGQPVIDWTVNPRVHELFSERAESAKERRDGIRENLQALQERRFDDVDFDRLRVQGDRLRD